MAAPAVAIMLTAFAKLVAAEAGRRISQDIAAAFIKLVFGHLATSNDIKNAVNQINAFTEQKFEELSRENILSPVLSAQQSLFNFQTITSVEGFDEAAAMFFASAAHQSCNDALGHVLFKYGENKDFLRSNAALISKFIVVDIGALAALSSLKSDFENVLVRRLGEAAQMLKQMNRDIRVYEIPTITKEWTDSFFTPDTDFEVFGDIRPFRRGEYTFRAFLHLESGRYKVEELFRLGGRVEELPNLAKELRTQANSIIAKRQANTQEIVSVLKDASEALESAGIAQASFINSTAVKI